MRRRMKRDFRQARAARERALARAELRGARPRPEPLDDAEIARAKLEGRYHVLPPAAPRRRRGRQTTLHARPPEKKSPQK